MLIILCLQRTNAKVVLGHCAETFWKYKVAPESYT
jgi:hypothetical protein